MLWPYLAGLATIPVLGALAFACALLLRRNLEKSCTRCGGIFGSLDKPRTFDVVTNLHFKAHRWFGQCERMASQ